MVAKKRTKKEKPLIEKYEYSGGGELIMDKPSVPLTKNNTVMKQEKPVSKSNKELYESYIHELKNFSLSINGEIIYDSSIDKTKKYPIIFENDFFILYGKKYSYNGLKIQKIN